MFIRTRASVNNWYILTRKVTNDSDVILDRLSGTINYGLNCIRDDKCLEYGKPKKQLGVLYFQTHSAAAIGLYYTARSIQT